MKPEVRRSLKNNIMFSGVVAMTVLFALCVNQTYAETGALNKVRLFPDITDSVKTNKTYPEILFAKNDISCLFRVESDSAVNTADAGLIEVYSGTNNTHGGRIASYGWDSFREKGDVKNVYEKDILLEGKQREEAAYKVLLKCYKGENSLIAGDESVLRKYGKLSKGIFESKTIVVDKKPPAIEEEISLSAEGNQKLRDGITYYDRGVRGSLSVLEKYFCEDKIKLCAIPLDAAARRSADALDAAKDGYLDVLKWNCSKDGGSRHNISFSFREQGKWRFVFTCEDAAGNVLETGGDGRSNEAVSDEFVIDSVSPKLSVEYKNQRGINSGASSPDNVNNVIEKKIKRLSSPECEIFADQDLEVKISVNEDYLAQEKTRIKIIKLNYEDKKTYNVTERYLPDKDRGIKTGDNYEFRCTFRDEGHYRFYIECEDILGHKMLSEENSETEACIAEGKYTSPMCTVDRTAPVVERLVYKNSPANQKEGRVYFTGQPVAEIRVIEENFNKTDFSFRDSLTFADGSSVRNDLNETDYMLKWEVSYEDGRRVNHAVLTIEDEANHTFFLTSSDVGNHCSEPVTEWCTYDVSEPEINYQPENNGSGDVIFYSGAYQEKKKNQSCIFINYDSFRYFSKDKFTVLVTAHDEISGVQDIRYYFTDKTGKKINVSSDKRMTAQQDGSERRILITINEKDLKGYLYIQAVDNCHMKSRKVHCRGMAAESGKMHERTSSINIDLPRASYTDRKRKIKYYRSDLTVKATAKDGHSGIYQMDMQAYEKGRRNLSEKTEELYQRAKETYRETLGMSLSAAVYKETSYNNPVKLRVMMRDNAGYESVKDYSEYKVVIDNVKPEVSVRYNTYDAKNKKYYNKPRVATVMVKDQNFNQYSSKWTISGSNKNYQMEAWHGEGDLHWCTVRFDQDGDNYKIKLKAADYAGNCTVWDRDEAFTIDRTLPRLSVKTGQEKGGHEKNLSEKNSVEYCNESQTLFLQVNERNFSEKDTQLRLWRESGNSRKKIPVGSFVLKENQYKLFMELKKEGRYFAQIRCMDLAGNTARNEGRLEFVIDKTAPDITVSGVEEGMGYADKVLPEVTFTDLNFDVSSAHVSVNRADGKDARVKDFPVQKKISRNKVKFVWENFPNEKWIDGIYSLKAEGKDLAGNKFSLKKGITFYVNRQGAEYTLDNDTKRIVEGKYWDGREDICIRETSVMDTETRIVIWKDNQERKELRESDLSGEEADYDTLYSCKGAEGKKGWICKTYRIHKDNFVEEGVYRIIINTKGYIERQGEKRIIKETTNQVKGQPIEFTVDRTPPSVSVSGLEEDVYEENNHTFKITAMDDYEFSYLDVKVSYKGGKKADKTMRFYREDFDAMHGIAVELEKYNAPQTVSYVAADAAGNKISSEETDDDKTCLITTSRLARSWHHYPWLPALMAIIAVGAGLSVVIKRGLNFPEKK